MAPEKKMPYRNMSLNFKDISTQQLISSSTYDPSLVQVHNDILPEGSATCEQGGGFDYKNEIIEFPVLLIESKTFKVVDVFHSYVKPSNNPVLSKFCIELTGIPQSTIDISPSFPEVLCRFQDFLYSHKLFIDNSCAFLTDGPWDIRDFITKQCNVSKIPRPKYFSLPWVDVRTMFAKFYNCRPRNIPNMLAHYGLKFEGHEHSGIDDAKNLAFIAKRLWEDGAVFRTNRRLQR
ncbi:ribonuclease H-like domain-containing protein [Gigaspora rosea]|uniref:Ribonuclease H-like domain-containing protein n=1 Tax=Gigaspora rosea TaxID=44941 RepID=A0A397URJ4_9GLOM|nr:ribonuclease H-like domain-containing protein [Gigaspora rosea]